MSQSEIFNQSRMDRCTEIQRLIMTDWQKTNSFNYIVKATDSLNGADLDELRKRYFAVGVHEDKLVEVPFADLLVIFSLIEQEVAAPKSRKDKALTNFTPKFEVTTVFSDAEAVRLFSSIRVQTKRDG